MDNFYSTRIKEEKDDGGNNTESSESSMRTVIKQEPETGHLEFQVHFEPQNIHLGNQENVTLSTTAGTQGQNDSRNASRLSNLCVATPSVNYGHGTPDILPASKSKSYGIQDEAHGSSVPIKPEPACATDPAESATSVKDPTLSVPGSILPGACSGKGISCSQRSSKPRIKSESNTVNTRAEGCSSRGSVSSPTLNGSFLAFGDGDAYVSQLEVDKGSDAVFHVTSLSQQSPWRNSPSWTTSEFQGFRAEQEPSVIPAFPLIIFSPLSTQPYVINDVTDYISYEERRLMHYLSIRDTRGRNEADAGEERRDLEDMEVSSSEEEEETATDPGSISIPIGQYPTLEKASPDARVAQHPESGVQSNYLSETVHINSLSNPLHRIMPPPPSPLAANLLLHSRNICMSEAQSTSSAANIYTPTVSPSPLHRQVSDSRTGCMEHRNDWNTCTDDPTIPGNTCDTATLISPDSTTQDFVIEVEGQDHVCVKQEFEDTPKQTVYDYIDLVSDSEPEDETDACDTTSPVSPLSKSDPTLSSSESATESNSSHLTLGINVTFSRCQGSITSLLEVQPQPPLASKPEAPNQPSLTSQHEGPTQPSITSKPEVLTKPSLTSQQEVPAQLSLTSQQEAPAKPSITSQQEVPAKPSLTSQQEAPAKPSLTSQQEAPAKPSLTSQQEEPAKTSLTSQQEAPAKTSLTSQQEAPAIPSLMSQQEVQSSPRIASQMEMSVHLEVKTTISSEPKVSAQPSPTLQKKLQTQLLIASQPEVSVQPSLTSQQKAKYTLAIASLPLELHTASESPVKNPCPESSGAEKHVLQNLLSTSTPAVRDKQVSQPQVQDHPQQISEPEAQDHHPQVSKPEETNRGAYKATISHVDEKKGSVSPSLEQYAPNSEPTNCTGADSFTKGTTMKGNIQGSKAEIGQSPNSDTTNEYERNTMKIPSYKRKQAIKEVQSSTGETTVKKTKPCGIRKVKVFIGSNSEKRMSPDGSLQNMALACNVPIDISEIPLPTKRATDSQLHGAASRLVRNDTVASSQDDFKVNNSSDRVYSRKGIPSAVINSQIVSRINTQYFATSKKTKLLDQVSPVKTCDKNKGFNLSMAGSVKTFVNLLKSKVERNRPVTIKKECESSASLKSSLKPTRDLSYPAKSEFNATGRYILPAARQPLDRPGNDNICPVCDFKAVDRKLMMHVYNSHLPWYFSCHIKRDFPDHFQTKLKCQLEPIIRKVHKCDRDQQLLIQKIIGCLIHDYLEKILSCLELEGDLETLVQYVNNMKLHLNDSKAVISSGARFSIVSHMFFIKDFTSSFKVAPPSCVSSLAHWCTLAKLLDRAGEKVQSVMVCFEKETAGTILRRLGNVMPVTQPISYTWRLRHEIQSAITNGQVSVLWEILQNNPNRTGLDAGDQKQSPFISHALARRQFDCATVLLLHGSNVNQANNLGETPLKLAVTHGDHLCISFLKLWGPLNQLQEAIELAKQIEKKHILDVLIKYQQKCSASSPSKDNLSLHSPLPNQVDDKKYEMRGTAHKISELPAITKKGTMDHTIKQEYLGDTVKQERHLKARKLDLNERQEQDMDIDEDNTEEKHYACPICWIYTKEWSALQEHVCTVHLPWYIGLRYITKHQTAISELAQKLLPIFRNLEDRNDSNLHECFKHCLGRLLDGFLQKCATALNLSSVSDLLFYITRHNLYPYKILDSDIHPLDTLLIDSHCFYIENERCEDFSISPPKRVSELIHWYTLANIISRMPIDYQKNLQMYEKYSHTNLILLKTTMDAHAKDDISITKDELRSAIALGELGKVWRLISNCTRVLDEPLNENGHTALHCAILDAKIEIAIFLLLCQANVDAKDKEGNTSLFIATKLNKRKVVLLLTYWGAIDQLYHCLDFASIHGHSNIMKHLMTIQKGKCIGKVADRSETDVRKPVLFGKCALCEATTHHIKEHVIEHHLPWYLSAGYVLPDFNKVNCTQLAMQLGPSIHFIGSKTLMQTGNPAVYKIWGKLIDGFMRNLSVQLQLPSVGCLLDYATRMQLHPLKKENDPIQKNWSIAFTNFHGTSMGYNPTKPASLGDILHWWTLYNLLLNIPSGCRDELFIRESYSWTPDKPYIPDITGPKPQPNMNTRQPNVKESTESLGSCQEGSMPSSQVKQAQNIAAAELTAALLTVDLKTVSRLIEGNPELVLQKYGPSHGGIIAHFVSQSDSSFKAAEMIRLLLLHGAPIDAVDMNGATALHRALWCRKKGLIVTLIVWGASITIKTNKGLDAVETATAERMDKIFNNFTDIIYRLPGNIQRETSSHLFENLPTGDRRVVQAKLREDASYCSICFAGLKNEKLSDHIFDNHLPWYTWLTKDNGHLLSGHRNSGLARVISLLMVHYHNWSRIRCVRILLGELLNNVIVFLDINLPGELKLVLDGFRSKDNEFLKEGIVVDRIQLRLIRIHQECVMQSHHSLTFEHPNCFSALLHWKWLGYLIRKLPRQKQIEFRNLEECTIPGPHIMSHHPLSYTGSQLLNAKNKFKELIHTTNLIDLCDFINANRSCLEFSLCIVPDFITDPVAYICAHSKYLCLLILYIYGADLNARDTNMNTALHLAVRNGDIDGVQFLLDLGANPNVRNRDSVTPLALAKDKNFVIIAKHLISKGAC